MPVVVWPQALQYVNEWPGLLQQLACQAMAQIEAWAGRPANPEKLHVDRAVLSARIEQQGQ